MASGSARHLARFTGLILAIGCGVGGCGHSSDERDQGAAADRFDATLTWAGQAEERGGRASEAVVAFDRDALVERGASSDELGVRLVDGLRGAAVTGRRPEQLLPEDAGDPWRARLLRRGARLSGSASAVAELERELAVCEGSREVGGLIREAAVRASLAHAMVLEARTVSTPEELRRRLETAAAVVEGYCQVPEALLNLAAIQLELSDLVGRIEGRDAPSARDHLRRAEAALDALQFNDAASCGETAGGFFGTLGSGSRFTYVLDKSASMNTPGGFPEMQRHMARTLRELAGEVAFSVLFFTEPSRRGGAARGTNYYEIPVPAELDDGTGMFRRGAFDGGGKARLEVVENAIASIELDGSTEPAEAIGRALDLNSSTIYLLTDGMIETPDSRLSEITARARAQGAVIHAILFFRQADIERWVDDIGYGEGLRKLRKLARETGGTVVTASQATGSTDEARVDRANMAPSGVAGGLREMLWERMERRGYWTAESTRQFFALRAGMELRHGRFDSALECLDQALRAPVESADIVTLERPTAGATADWPRLDDGVPMPMDASMILESALVASLGGRRDLAAARYDGAARAAAHCMRRAESLGRREDCAYFADLGCRALLLASIDAAATGGLLDGREFGIRDPAFALAARDRAESLGLVRWSGWSQLLLDAAAGGLSNLKAGLQAALSDDSLRMSAELDLVRAYFRREGVPPTGARLAEFPVVEQLFLSGVADSIREEETP